MSPSWSKYSFSTRCPENLLLPHTLAYLILEANSLCSTRAASPTLEQAEQRLAQRFAGRNIAQKIHCSGKMLLELVQQRVIGPSQQNQATVQGNIGLLQFFLQHQELFHDVFRIQHQNNGIRVADQCKHLVAVGFPQRAARHDRRRFHQLNARSLDIQDPLHGERRRECMGGDFDLHPGQFLQHRALSAVGRSHQHDLPGALLPDGHRCARTFLGTDFFLHDLFSQFGDLSDDLRAQFLPALVRRHLRPHLQQRGEFLLRGFRLLELGLREREREGDVGGHDRSPYPGFRQPLSGNIPMNPIHHRVDVLFRGVSWKILGCIHSLKGGCAGT